MISLTDHTVPGVDMEEVLKGTHDMEPEDSVHAYLSALDDEHRQALLDGALYMLTVKQQGWGVAQALLEGSPEEQVENLLWPLSVWALATIKFIPAVYNELIDYLRWAMFHDARILGGEVELAFSSRGTPDMDWHRDEGGETAK